MKFVMLSVSEINGVGDVVQSCPLPSSFTVQTTSGTSPLGRSTVTNTFLGTFCNGAVAEFDFTLYSAAENIPFIELPGAELSVAVDANSVKLFTLLRNWPWKSEGNYLQIRYQMNLVGAVALSSSFSTSSANGGNSVWNIDLGGGVSIATSILNSVLLDQATVGYMAILGDDASPADPSIARFIVPFFRASLFMDPSFAVLVGPSGGGSSTRSISPSGVISRSYNAPLVVISSVLVGLAVLMVVTAIVAYLVASVKSEGRTRTVGSVSGSSSHTPSTEAGAV
jgi:hypothetical protein